jgi:hypothetical protein
VKLISKRRIGYVLFVRYILFYDGCWLIYYISFVKYFTPDHISVSFKLHGICIISIFY